MKKFYVYEHWRTDTDKCFYVGKGCGMRALDKKKDRNIHYMRVAAKLAASGHEVKIVIYCDGMDEASAFNMEMERIAFWRSQGVQLCNLTIGGDGIKGIGEETLSKMRASSKKRWQNPENRKRASETTKKKMQNSENRAKCINNLGQKMPDKIREKISKERLSNFQENLVNQRNF